MRRVAILLVLASLAVSCGGKGTSRFRGHWQGVEARGAPKGADPKSGNDFATAMDLVVHARDFTLTYRDKTVKVTVGSGYRVVRDEGNRITIETDLDKGEQAQFEFPTDNTLVWEATDTTRVIFERVVE